MSALATRGHVLLDVERARDLLRDSTDLDQIRGLEHLAGAEAYVRRVEGAGLASVNEAQEIVLRAQRRAGELLRGAKEAGSLRQGPRGKKSQEGIFYLADLEVSPKESARWQRLAEVPEHVFEQHILSTQARGEKLTTAGTIAATSESADYDSDEWYTPGEYIEAARDVMGGIDLDPASCPAAQVRIGARHFFTKGDDGLRKKWKGRVWLNPPYSQPAATDFAAKLIAEIDVGNVTQAVMVQNSATDTAWFHTLAARAWICLHKRRINFLREGGDSAANRYAQCFFYFGPEHERFVEIFGRFGLVGKLSGAPE